MVARCKYFDASKQYIESEERYACNKRRRQAQRVLWGRRAQKGKSTLWARAMLNLQFTKFLYYFLSFFFRLSACPDWGCCPCIAYAMSQHLIFSNAFAVVAIFLSLHVTRALGLEEKKRETIKRNFRWGSGQWRWRVWQSGLFFVCAQRCRSNLDAVQFKPHSPAPSIGCNCDDSYLPNMAQKQKLVFCEKPVSRKKGRKLAVPRECREGLARIEREFRETLKRLLRDLT